LLSSGGAKKILFSGRSEWIDDIKGGFRHLPHQVEFGSITEDSFQRYDIVVPLSLPALEEARRLSPLQKNALPLPAAESVHLCDDKYEFNQALIKAGFGRYIPKMAQGPALPPPYILKKRIGSWGKECYIIRNCGDEEAQRDRITDTEYFCQEFIPGTAEFATHILFVDGRIAKALNIKYEFPIDTPIKGQDADHLKVIQRCPYLDLFARVLRTIQFEGLCCVNYKVAKSQPFLLEINPRFGGSLAPYFFSFVRHLR
jgi:predicted ATP-grasp superfamily ATP-dependent carboligase